MVTRLNRHLGCILLAGFVWTAAAHAQNYPVRPVRFVAPFPPGSGADVLGRIYAPKLAEMLGQQFVIDNRPGASGNIAAALVAKATPDGYTLLLNVTSIPSSQPLFKDLSFDVARDFEHIGMLGVGAYLLVVSNQSPAKSVKELIALVKANPKKLSYASTGLGGGLHLTMELFLQQAGISMLHVPYKGSQVTVPDLIGGRVDAMFGSSPSLAPHVRGGRMRALAISSAKRSAGLPDIPTIAESGLTGFESVSWFALAAPAKTPRAIINQLAAAMTKTAQMPEIAAAVNAQGNEIPMLSPTETDKFVRGELEKWRKVIAAAGIKPD